MHAAYWDASGQLHDLMVVLRAMGLGRTGWTLFRANAVSAEGRTIVGTGINPTGGIEGWLAVIPEPETAVLLELKLTTLARAKGGGRPARRLV